MRVSAEYKNGLIWIFLACVVSNISNYPVLVSNGIGRDLAVVAWTLLAVSLFFRGMYIGDNLFFRVYMLLYFLFTLNTCITGIINDVNAFGNHFFQIVTISTIIFNVAMRYGINFESNDLKRVCIWYYFTTSIMSIPLYIFYLRGVNLSSRIYGYDYGKNSIAVLLLCSLIIGFVLYDPNNRLKKIFKIISILLLLVDILYLRCRSSFLGVAFLFGTLSIYSNKMTQKLRISVLLFLLGITVYFIVNPESFDMFLNQIVFAGRDSSDVSSLSSGRDQEIKQGLELFINAPFFGFGHAGTTIDCFYASALANYGLLAWPLIVMALLPVIWSCLNLKNGEKVDLCFFIIAFSMFFISVFEELAPFGPGSRCYILWLMWGILLQINDRNRVTKIIVKR